MDAILEMIAVVTLFVNVRGLWDKQYRDILHSL